ncbi:ubiquitin-conjugating enzyme E2 11 [Eutrema salsugineum]|uniref:ubiquitin-conjugating enzyme E2 11 n=1 Tax=Eutrema salsugineum TaxID=72664 RepID=UPI000CECF952|nr:ubiquitin-conjugating enzyme E2 11 [Eutrema salsugineum]
MAHFTHNIRPASSTRPEYWMHRYLLDLQRNPSPIYSAGVEAEDVYVWAVTITGPPRTPYEGGVFFPRIIFPPDFPWKPPKCIATSVAQMLMSLAQMLLHPLVAEGDVVREEVAVMYREDWTSYEELARSFTKIHVMDG